MKTKEWKKILYNFIVIGIIASIFVFGLQMRPKAKLESEDEIIARLQKENEDNPESTSYLVTDEYISNILPKTTVEELRRNIRETVRIYEDESKENEVEKGIIKTGMVIEYIDNGRSYEVSVLGDIDRDGALNQIELTREIREIVKAEDWKIEEEIEKKAGDIRRDKKIDEEDTEKIIEYIVYGKLEVDRFKTIVKPEIKVISGKLNKDRYDSNVEIEIKQKDENGQRTVYKVTDSNESEDGQYVEIENRETFKIEKDGIYKITAYTYGVEGNKSKGETVIILREKPTYTVKYTAGTHGTFETQTTSKLYIGDETPEFEGEIEGEEGYKFAGWNKEIAETVTGNAEYIAIWEAEEYKIEYDLDGGKVEGINPEKYTIESENITLNNPKKEGYEFLGWTGSNGKKAEKVVTIAKGSTGNKKYTANWEGKEGVPYRVETYKMNTEGKYEKTETEYRGKANEKITLDTTAEKGFTYEAEKSKISGTIKADGSTVLKIYFSRNQYTLKIVAENGISKTKINGKEGQTQEKKIYYQAKAEIEAKIKEGYEWKEYTSNNKEIGSIKATKATIEMPAENVILTATTKMKEYKIEYDLDGGRVVGINPEKYTIESDNIKLINPKKYGYEFKGWTGSNGEEAEETIIISKGSTGNKAYKANWEGAEGTEYTVKTYIMNVEGEYEETVEKFTARTDEEIELKIKEVKGFTYEEEKSISKGKVLVDGSTVLKLYFSRNKYTVEIEAETGIENVKGGKEYYYEEEVRIEGEAKESYEWKGLEKEGEIITEEKTYTFNMPAENIKLIAKAKAKEYTIAYNLNGGTLGENLSKYTIETESFTLNNPSKEGYTFIGWTGSNGEEPEETVTIAKGSTGNKEYTANYRANTYTITYNLNEGTLGENIENPESYTVESEDITLNNPSKEGYKFIGWTGSNGEEPEETVTIAKGSTGNKEYTANYQANTNTIYKISVYTMNVEGKYEKETTEYTGATGEEITADTEAREGFTYEEEKSTPTGVIAPDGSTELEVYFSRNKYKVTTKIGYGIERVEGEGTYYYEQQITINAEVKEGYTWSKWKSNSEKITDILEREKQIQIPAENIELTAISTLNTYTITYNLNGGTLGENEENLSKYTIETESFTLNNPSKEGYTFIGWTGSNGEEPEETVTIAKGSTGNKEYIANYRANTYTITYNLNEGTLGENIENPESYTIESEDITLNNPSKIGYTFIGWTGSNGEEPEETVTITKGSTGNKEYTANYQANTNTIYKISVYTMNVEGEYEKETTEYAGATGEEITADTEAREGFTYEEEKSTPTGVIAPDGSTELEVYFSRNKYKVTTKIGYGIERVEGQGTYYYEQQITINAEVKEGYTWSKWKSNSERITDILEQEKQIKIPAKNIELTAVSTLNTYTITYNLNEGTLGENIENPEAYTVESENITLNNPSKIGYTFIGWTGSNGEEPEETVTITKGSTGNKEYTANYQINEYTITLDANKGTVDPESITAEYNTNITIPTPERKYNIEYITNGGTEIPLEIVNYTFEGWYTEREAGEKVEYQKMPANNEKVYAHWTEKSTVLGETSKTGYTFTGWYKDEGLTEKIGVAGDTFTPTENTTLYAGWEINGYTITIHHKEDIIETKIAEDETYAGEYGEEYQITDLITNNGANGRTWLNPDKYYYVRTEGVSEGTYEANTEITFYYGVNTFNITGQAEEGGSITEITETVRYGENSTKDIVITPETGKRVDIITLNGEEIEFEEDEYTKIVNLSKFENVIENKEIVVTFKDIIMVARITESPNAELIGTEYDSLKKALEALNKSGLNSESEATTIQIISEIEDESNVVENQNVIIDLAGKRVTSLQDKPTITVGAGKLRIIDSANEGGAITNSATSAIEVNAEGNLTIGEDDENVYQTSPSIEGINYGVNNKGGIFNYYDGIIKGTIAINGNVTDLPYLKNPGITKEEEKQVAILATILDAEATIGKKTFTQLELAIDYANKKIGTDGSQVEIVIVKDLTKDDILIDSSKNIKLNLNGYRTTLNNKFINEGKLEIVDTTEEQAGIISSSLEGEYSLYDSSMINKGTMVISGGTITSNGRYSYTIKNEKTGKLTINAGNVSATGGERSDNSSIYNIGNMTVTGGTITSSNSKGIYNAEEGNATVNGGTIIAYYGIYNTSIGNLIVTGGNINAVYGINNRNLGNVQVSNAIIKITANSYYGIYNYSNGEIKLENVEISSDYVSNYAIHNNSGGKITLTKSRINLKASNNSSVGIDNCASGEIVLNNTTISAQYGICNQNDLGTITIKDSIIENSTYGIYNSGKGNIVITGGKINVNQYGIENKNGEVIVKDVSITQKNTYSDTAYSYAGIYNSNAGNITVDGGKIDADSFGITNNGTGTITITNGAIINSACYDGVCNAKTGIITIEDAKINTSGNNYRGIYNVGNGIINIGNSEDEIKSDTPMITSKSIGIHNVYGTLNLYDGTIKALNDKIMIGKITSMPDNVELVVTQNDDGTETARLGNDEAVVKIGETIYNSLEKAIEASNDGDVIIYQKDAVISNEITIAPTKNVIIDLAGNTVRMYNSIRNQGNLKITDSSKTEEVNGTGTLKTYGISSIINLENAQLTIEEGSMINNISGSSSNTYICLIQNYGELKIINGTLRSTGKYNFSINNKSTGALTIEGGEIISSGEASDGIWNYGTLLIKTGSITGSRNGILNREAGTVTITGGTITSTANNGNGINNVSTQDIIITNGNINSKYYGIYNDGTSKISITDTNITATDNYGIYNNNIGTIEISGGVITAYSGIYNKSEGEVKAVGTQIAKDDNKSGYKYGVYNYSKGIITLTDTSITMEDNLFHAYAIYNNGLGKFILDNINLSVTNNQYYDCIGIYNNTGEIVVKSGTIDVVHNDTRNDTRANAYGIYNNGTGTVTIGEIGRGVSTILPKITATSITNSYGIYNIKGTLNFYDGIVTAKEGYSLYNLISDQEEGYEVIKEINEDGTESATLQKLAIAQIVSTGKKYYSIQEAINEIRDTKETVQILRDASLSSTTETIVINENKDVVIDLNGKKVEVGNVNTIQNAGILEIVDSSKTEESEGIGALINTATGTKDEYKTLINNTGEMKLTEGTLKITGNYGKVISNNAGATLEVNGGKIISSVNNQCFGIYNLGTTNVNGGKINSRVNAGNTNECSYGINTEGEGNLTITAGEVTVSSNGGYSAGGYHYSTMSEAICNNSIGTTSIIGGTISATEGYYINTVINKNVGEIIIKNVTITAPTSQTRYYGIYGASAGKITIENSTIEAGYGIYNNSTGQIIVKDTNINTLYDNATSNYGIYNNNIGTIEISGGVITSHSGIYNNSTGEIRVNGAQIISNDDDFGERYGINNRSTGIITLTDTNITISGKASSYGIYNYDSGKVMIDNITLTVTNNSESNCMGIYNDIGEIVLKSGTVDVTHTSIRNNISDNAYGIYNNGTGTVTIGEIGGEVSTSLPRITATSTTSGYGIYNINGVLNFYDGIATGTEGYALYKVISDQEEGYEVIKQINEDGSESVTLQKLPIAQIVSTGAEYNSVQEAIEMCGESATETIKILRDGIISTSSKEILVKEAQDIIIDLNGHMVTLCRSEAIKNNGKLEIKDSSKTEESEGTGTLEAFKDKLIVNNEGAILTISSGTLINRIRGKNYAFLSEIMNNGQINITGGTITSTESSTYIINNTSTGKLEMTGGAITASVDGYSIYGICNTGNAEIVGGTINIEVKSYNNSFAIYNGENGNLIMTGGIITSTSGNYSYGIYSNTTGVTTVSGVTITSGYYGIYNSNIGEITVENSTITTESYGIYNDSNGKINIEASNIIATSNSKSFICGIQNNKAGEIVLKSGTIQAMHTGNPSYNKAYGVYNASTGTITIGVKDRNVNNGSINIQGTTNGLYINKPEGNVYFYDGTIIGDSKALYGEIDELEEGYEVNITENETKATLKVKDATVESVASVGNIYYDTIKEAINAIGETGTITVNKEIEQKEQIVIPQGKNITIDMQAHAITYEKNEALILVEEGATLTIIDSYEDGTDEAVCAQLHNTAGVLIENNGILHIGVDDENVYTNSPRIQGQTTAIENNGELHIYDGTITGTIIGTGIKEDKR